MTYRFFCGVVLGCWLVPGLCQAVEIPPPARPLPEKMTVAPGPFQPTWESLKTYQCPDWFRDAKLGIWAVWGPESVPEQGDWYARQLYIEGHPQYLHHLQTYGPPSKFGYKDIIPLWKAERWDPDRLMAAVQKGRGQVLLRHCPAPRQLRLLELEISSLELGQPGTQTRHHGRMEEGGAEVWPAFRRHRTPGGQLGLVRRHEDFGQKRSSGWRSL